jgi:hypothetical protein
VDGTARDRDDPQGPGEGSATERILAAPLRNCCPEDDGGFLAAGHNAGPVLPRDRYVTKERR